MVVPWKPAAVVAAIVALVTAAIMIRTVNASPAGEPSARPQDPLVLRQSKSEIERTYASLRRLDDHPLYEMTYHGGYDRLRPTPEDRTTVEPWGCTVFVASGNEDKPLFGRNFDWDDHPAMVVRTDPPDGYASLSVADVSYVLGETGPDPDDPVARAKLRYAALTPFDGMNEKGLTVGMAAVNRMNGPGGPDRPRVSSVRIMRILLDEAATVDEASSLMKRYTVDKDDGPPLHYLVADASGRSVVVELLDGEVKVFPGEGSWSLMVNFLLDEANVHTKRLDWRWRKASASLRRAGGKLSDKGAMGLLKKIAQDHTRWSGVYDMRSRTLRLAMGQRFGRTYTFRLSDG